MSSTQDKSIGIIDYGAGNLFNFQRAFDYIGVNSQIESAPSYLARYTHIILPGVGAFGPAICKLTQLGFTLAIKDLNKRNIPIMGVCLGFQLLFESSEEDGHFLGLGLVEGHVKSLRGFIQSNHVKIPHVGWSKIKTHPHTALFKNLNNKSFYFTHSYYAETQDSRIAQSTISINNQPICAAFESQNIYGTQFHPEMSGADGLTVLRNFVGIS